MIHFLIDYENVNYRGLEGVEYLQEDDRITIFYSDCCKKMEENKLRCIWESSCEVELVKLVSKRKNGLDFYIASKVGEILSNDNVVNVAIVSCDNGFKAVRDYWNCRLNPTSRLVINDTIASCIISSAETQIRKTPIQDAYRKFDIEEVMDSWKEIRLLQKNLHNAFDGTEYENIIPEIMDVFRKSSERKGLYLNSIKTFGKKNGLGIYNIIKYKNLYYLVS